MNKKPGELVKFVAAIIAKRWIEKNRPVKEVAGDGEETAKTQKKRKQSVTSKKKQGVQSFQPD